MKICFLGNTHLTICSAVAAARRGFIPVPEEEIEDADLVVVAQDVTTDDSGKRDLTYIDLLCRTASNSNLPTIVSSQVPPGYMRRLDKEHFFHHPETLRIKDASDRAMNPDYMVLGCMNPLGLLPREVMSYVSVFSNNLFRVSYESAEFSKIAVNSFLASQVDTTNRLSEAARKCGASWDEVSQILRSDKRIGRDAYLNPGRWQDSIHLLRDYVTLREIEDAR